MSETALKFGPEWLRNLSHGNSVSSPPTSPASVKYKLAEYRYGREEMLVLYNKDSKMPDLSEFSFLAVEKSQLPLAFLQMTEEEQRPWSRCVNSDIVIRLAGKGGSSISNSVSRGGGRGGSVDRGRGRGRGGYYQRGLSLEDEDGPFTRTRPTERSQSTNDREQRWEDRERRFDRPYAGRGGGSDENNVVTRKEGSRVPLDNWRKPREQGDDKEWRTAGPRGTEKWGRGSWRNQIDREKNEEESDKNSHGDCISNGPSKIRSHNKKSHCGWDDDEGPGDQLPEWSTEDDANADQLGTFDASGAFMESKNHENCSEDYDSAQDEADQERVSSPLEKQQECVTQVIKSTRPFGDKSKTEINCVQSIDESRTEVSKDSEQKEVQIMNNNQSFVNSTVHHTSVHENKVLSKSEQIPKIEHNSIGATVNNTTQVHTVVQRPSLNCSSNENIQDVKKDNHPVPIHPPPPPPVSSIPSLPLEEDNFAHLEKATENMVAEWTAEEEKMVSSQMVDKTTVLPLHHEDAYKWFYRDPQGEIQGPFSPSEMLEWFTVGYFTMGLMIRRGCDERFAQLGELIKTWGKVPFICNTNPPPLRVNPLPNPISSSLTQNAVPPPALQPQPNKEIQMRILQQQLLQQQLAQQQMIIRQQTQIHQLVNQLKQEESFNNLTSQQQQIVIMQHLIAQQQLQRSSSGAIDPQTLLDSISRGQLPHLGLSLSQMLKTEDNSLWAAPPTGFPGPWPINTVNQASGGSIWDIEPLQNRLIEDMEQKKKEKEEEERRKAEEERRLLEEKRKIEEEKQREEEKRRKEEEEKKRQEEIKKQEEERKRQEQLRKQQEEEERKRREEELKRQEEERKLEELRKQEEIRKHEELKKQEEERKRQELELQHQKQIEMEMERRRELERQKELERQEIEKRKEFELERQREIEKEWQKEVQKQRQQEALRKLQEQQRSKPQAPAWGGQTTTMQLSALSLSEIQKLQEEKEKKERDEKRLQQLQQLQALSQNQSNKSSLTWAQRSDNPTAPVKSLLEIQQEEAQRLAWKQKQQQQLQQQYQQHINHLGNSGVWGNTVNQLMHSSSNTAWNANDTSNSTMIGFWDDAVTSTHVHKNSKSNESAFPSLCNLVQPINETSNKITKTVKSKKDEETVLKLFEMHAKQNTDRFTQWCIDALSDLPSSVDVPTFVVFLKDIESPYEVHDYVKSYLGESKEAREFAKQFLERRSKFRNQSKQTPAEENMWGPAPAITPSVNKISSQHEFDCSISGMKGKKKKKNRMQKVDNSMLGFTVQPDPDRINVGEIDHIEGI